jgi:hypothetical protein
MAADVLANALAPRDAPTREHLKAADSKQRRAPAYLVINQSRDVFKPKSVSRDGAFAACRSSRFHT